MNRYVFPGYPVFLTRAAERLGVGATTTAGKPPAAMVSLANLCAQAVSAAEDEHAAAILAEAAKHGDRLLVAAEAAQMMLDEVGEALGLTHPVSAGDGETAEPTPIAPSELPSP